VTLRVVAYVRPRGFLNPTGVGKHQIHMVSTLARLPGVQLTLLASRADLHKFGGSATPALDALPRAGVRLPRRAIERMWATASFPVIERWCGEVDWMYCPFEAFFPTRKAKLAVTVHCVNWFERSLPWFDEPAVRRTRKRLQTLFEKIVKRADLIFVVSEFLKVRFCELFNADPCKVVVVGNGAEEEFFDVGRMRSAGEVLDTPPYALAIGALESRKGAEYVLGFARSLQRSEPGVRIVVAGGDCGDRHFVDEANKLPNVVLNGYVNTPALVELVRKAVALVILSRYDTFGIPAAEAMACGTPVIAGHFAGVPEVVADAGIVVDPTRPEEVLHAFRSLLTNPELRRKCREAGLTRSRMFTWENCAKRVIAAMMAVG
jgi:glycosyltransferase involved in cell wall biosynthesis